MNTKAIVCTLTLIAVIITLILITALIISLISLVINDLGFVGIINNQLLVDLHLGEYHLAGGCDAYHGCHFETAKFP